MVVRFPNYTEPSVNEWLQIQMNEIPLSKILFGDNKYALGNEDTHDQPVLQARCDKEGAMCETHAITTRFSGVE